MNEKHAPKNRKKSSLSVLDFRITDKNETFKSDPNQNIMMALTGSYPIKEPIPGLFSEISGKPAYRLEFDDLELALSFDELDRFFRRDLRNDEYEYLLNKYGMFHEIHEDFYWDGEAQQPIEIVTSTMLRIKSEQVNKPKVKK